MSDAAATGAQIGIDPGAIVRTDPAGPGGSHFGANGGPARTSTEPAVFGGSQAIWYGPLTYDPNVRVTAVRFDPDTVASMRFAASSAERKTGCPVSAPLTLPRHAAAIPRSSWSAV